MSDEDDNLRQGMGVGAIVAVAITIAIATALFMGVGMVRKSAAAKKATPAVVASSGAASGAGLGNDDQARIEVVDGVVRFYFASGKADIAPGAKEALADVVAAAKAGKTLTISGYHDSTGSAELNAELAKQRAISVRNALLAEGVLETSMDLKKPEVMPETHGADPKARRVDVAIN